jgi:hypothetical protein
MPIQLQQVSNEFPNRTSAKKKTVSQHMPLQLLIGCQHKFPPIAHRHRHLGVIICRFSNITCQIVYLSLYLYSGLEKKIFVK